MNLERGHGALAEEIAACIGDDGELDEMVAQVSPRRFEEILNAYKKESIREYIEAIKELLLLGGKEFKDGNDYYLANCYIQQLTIEALEHGGFRVPGEMSNWEKAKQAKIDLMIYLVEINSPYTEILSMITVDEPEEVSTLDKFMESRKETVREAFSSYRGEEYTDDRFNRIFSKIKKEAISQYENFKKDEAKRVKKGEPLLSFEQKINHCMEQINKYSEEHTKGHKAREDIERYLNTKSQYAYKLKQEHNDHHSK